MDNLENKLSKSNNLKIKQVNIQKMTLTVKIH